MAVIFNRTSELMVKHFFKALTEEEEKELNQILSTSPEMQSLLEELNDRELLATHLRERAKVDFKKEWGRILQEYPFKKRQLNWKVYLSAAATILFLSLGIYYLTGKKNHQKVVMFQEKVNKPVIVDSTQTHNLGTLTFSDNTTAILENLPNGEVKHEGATLVIKQDTVLIYKPTGGSVNRALFNTLSIPRKGKYQIQLPDGSNVWLNAASAIRYPTSFTGTEREVAINGEAYFEVSKDTARPFKVLVLHSLKDNFQSPNNKVEFKVLGTEFNINAYNDEEIIRATVIKGVVKVLSGSQTRLLKRGQQAEISKDLTISIKYNADVYKSIAWKHGDFSFKDDDIKTILRELSRCYNVTVNYQGPISPDRFDLDAPRKYSLPAILDALKKNHNFFYKVENNIITASSSPLP